MSRHRNWIISGATGFIGRELVRRLLLTSKDRLTLLVRDIAGRQSAEQRVCAMLDSLGLGEHTLRSRITTVAGDVGAPGLGLAAADRQRLLGQHSIVLHLAASTCFSSTLTAARHSNVEGTAQMMALARELQRKGKLDTFVHVSTAFVGADRTDLVGADELDMNAGFRNAYERSKAEAEQMVRLAMGELPSVIFRPSIVVGNSVTGEADGGNTIYWGLKQYLRGQNFFFARPGATLDMVPVDYVVDAMVAIMQRADRHGKCYPLVAGPDKHIPLGEFAARISAYFQRPAPRILSPRLLDPAKTSTGRSILARLLRSPRQQRFIDHMLSYLPYFSSNPVFDDSATAAALRGTGIEVPYLQDYLPVLLGYCERKGWARPPQRPRRRPFNARVYDKLSAMLKYPIRVLTSV